MSVPSLVTLPEAEWLKLKRLLLFTEPGAWSELLDVAADVVDLGWAVISEPIEARPLSELALQFPEEECGSSLFPPLLLNLKAALSLNFTVNAVGAAGTLVLDFSEDVLGLRSWVIFFSRSTLRRRRRVTVS